MQMNYINTKKKNFSCLLSCLSNDGVIKSLTQALIQFDSKHTRMLWAHFQWQFLESLISHEHHCWLWRFDLLLLFRCFAEEAGSQLCEGSNVWRIGTWGRSNCLRDSLSGVCGDIWLIINVYVSTEGVPFSDYINHGLYAYVAAKP